MSSGNDGWPGWPLTSRSYDTHFDQEARARMVAGSRELLPMLRAHEEEMGRKVLEVGPFFNPLVTPESFSDKEITYWENDPHAVGFLKSIRGTRTVPVNLNALKTSMPSDTVFDSVVASQVFNYLDYRTFLRNLHRFLARRGLLFVNNIAEHGIPDLFSAGRPKNAEETLAVLEASGFDIVEHQLVPADIESQESRLLAVARLTK